MNRYLKEFINSLFRLAIGFVGVLFSLNILVGGVLFLPEVMGKVSGYIVPGHTWWHGYIPGAMPMFFLITTTALYIFVMFLTIKTIKEFDIEIIVKKLGEVKDE